METNQKAFRRIVTGHDADGKAIIISDAAPERTYMIGGPKGAKFHEVWNTQQSPALIDNNLEEPQENNLVLGPPKGGTRIRVIDFPPEGEEIRNLTKDEANKHFKSMGGEEASKAGQDAAHPLMHRTETIDYGIVLEGELTLIVDRGERTINAGDIIIQRGTNHAWANRSGKNCRVAFILIDGRFDESLL
ncbi:cupin domain-containing protein [Flavobacterium sp. ANB]|uniref:cupin domain-containing protein n=1 Tax=unclassified Flavobacterium TaxID=196869 RepID=UPI0012B75C8A|nr:MULTISPECIES: cupin domain-containing protein [unclassified Flavobacterium]MBF4516927.1 cupin domain-containing protein [Flavobacterium sp. ANB]MTD69177.1 cupin domain-containing protein [Flavobacterium sp. LC2016-13]